MKNVTWIVVSSLCVAGLAIAGEKAKASGAVLTPVADLKFADLAAFPGVQMAVAEGDPGKGPSHFYLKYAAGFSAGTHHHSPDHHVTVVSGTLVLGADGKDTKLPAGSYFAFTSKAKHSTKCEAGADCVIFIDARGKWDVVPEAAKK